MAVRTPEEGAVHHFGLDSAVMTSTRAVDAADLAEILLPSARFATDASYLQQGDDLVLVGSDGTTFIVRGYFLLNSPPDLVTPEGGRIGAALVEVNSSCISPVTKSPPSNKTSPSYFGAFKQSKSRNTVFSTSFRTRLWAICISN